MASRFLPEMFGVGNKMPLTYEQRLAALARRRRAIEGFQDKIAQGTQGQMVSGHYVSMGPWAALAQIAGAGLEKFGGDKMDREEADLVKQREAEFEAAMQNMPQDQVLEGPRANPEEAGPMPPTLKKAGPQDWMKWGGRMAQLGPMGQQVGQAAVQAGLGQLLPKIATPKYTIKELPSEDGKTKRYAYFDENNPLAPPIPVGNNFPAVAKDSALEQRMKLSQKAIELTHTPNRTPEQEKELQATIVALNAITSVATEGGGVANVSKVGVAASGGLPQAAPPLPPGAQPAAPQAPQGMPPQGTPPQQAMPPQGPAPTPPVPGVPQPSMPPRAPGLFNVNLQNATPADINAVAAEANKSAGVQKSAPNGDTYAPYRDDPRNAPYIPKVAAPGSGVSQAVQGTGAQQRLNTDVEKLAKVAQDEHIPVLEDAWAEFEKLSAKVREGNKRAAEQQAKRSPFEKALDAVQFGKGYGGTLGISNVLPNALTEQEGRQLRTAVEKLKAFERNRLFGQTLTGNEKMSFEQMAGTLFGMDDADFEYAMKNMRSGFEAGKQAAFAGYAPIVIDTWNKQRARGGGERKPWFNPTF